MCPFACPACPVAPGDGTGIAPKMVPGRLNETTNEHKYTRI